MEIKARTCPNCKEIGWVQIENGEAIECMECSKNFFMRWFRREILVPMRRFFK